MLRVDRDRKARVLWQKLDCLKSNPDLVPQRPSGKTPETAVLLCRLIVISSLHPSAQERVTNLVKQRDEWTAYGTLSYAP